MVRIVCVLAVAASASAASAQQWAEKMFSEKSFDFGGVPRASKVEHEFVVKNLYKDDVHIAYVRSSCGCTQPRIENSTIKSGDQGKIVAAFNTQSFTGQRGATVTVTIDRPQWAEVQLQVKGYIRTDVVLSPGQVNFGSVAEGEADDKKVEINYAGRDDWKITGVKSNSPYLTADVKETRREHGRVAYALEVKLADNAPAGYLNDTLTLSTNDRRAKEFPVTVEARVQPTLSVSPARLLLGTVQPGQQVSKQLVVKGAKPFKIVDIRCDEAAFDFKATDEAKTVHLVPVIFAAPAEPGKLNSTIEIVTDLGEGQTLTLPVSAQVATPLAAAR